MIPTNNTNTYVVASPICSSLNTLRCVLMSLGMQGYQDPNAQQQQYYDPNQQYGYDYSQYQYGQQQ
jgi:hypothetical protein